jgi:hypothetical protein
VGYQRDYLKLDCQGCPRQTGLLGSFGIQGLQAPSPQYENIRHSVSITLLGWEMVDISPTF